MLSVEWLGRWLTASSIALEEVDSSGKQRYLNCIWRSRKQRQAKIFELHLKKSIAAASRDIWIALEEIESSGEQRYFNCIWRSREQWQAKIFELHLKKSRAAACKDIWIILEEIESSGNKCTPFAFDDVKSSDKKCDSSCTRRNRKRRSERRFYLDSGKAKAATKNEILVALEEVESSDKKCNPFAFEDVKSSHKKCDSRRTRGSLMQRHEMTRDLQSRNRKQWQEMNPFSLERVQSSDKKWDSSCTQKIESNDKK
jgi:hypothetical protein